MTSVNITNDIKKILREKYNIQNITASRIKAGYQSTDDFYKYLYELYIKDKQIELEQLKEKEKIETELKEKLDKLKQKNKLKKLKYKLNKKKKINNDLQDNISENIDDVKSTINNRGFHSENDLNDAKNDVKCNDTDNDENNDTNNDLNDKDNDSTDEPYDESTDDSSNDINNNKYIESYDNNKLLN